MKYIIIIMIALGFVILVLALLLIASFPVKYPLSSDLNAFVTNIDSKSYLMILSEREEAIKNPIYPIECVDYKFISTNQVGITKYKIFNVFSLLKNDPIMTTFPVMIPMEFFKYSSNEIEVLYWTEGRYILLGSVVTINGIKAFKIAKKR